MTRRSPPPKATADRTYPLVGYFRVPGDGTAGAGIDPHNWLQRNLGTGRYELYAAGRLSRDVMAIYFRRVADLVAFAEAHPTLELADDVGNRITSAADL